MILIDAWKAWFLAVCIVIFDVLLILTMVHQPVAQPVERSDWDFRISELRQLEADDGSYAWRSPSESVDDTGVLEQSLLLDYFTGLQDPWPTQPWWLATGASAPIRGQTHPLDAAGRVL